MHPLTDQELIDELKSRFQLNRKALSDLEELTQKLEEMNHKLADSEAVKSHFLSNIRNEINNPLTAILGLAKHLKNGQFDPATATRLGGLIFNEAYDLDFQLRNIFVAAEMEAGAVHPDLAHVDLPAMVRGTLDLLQHLAEAKEIVFELTATVEGRTSDSFVFTTDAQKLQVALTNLLSNAVEYSPQGGKVEIGVELSESVLRLSVRDHGVGIDVSEHEHIFDRFHQMESGTTKSHRGHGLGLSITRAVVELLGGSVSVSSARGEGAHFVLVLPEPEDEGVSVFAQDGNFFLFEDGEVF
ncbi:MAG: histidine kinase [Desulfuromonas sp.]|nr:MAG: histidine kinase [Desulfuromonas sp.]